MAKNQKLASLFLASLVVFSFVLGPTLGLAAEAKKEAKPGIQQAIPAVVNINSAGSEELQALKGVGPALAERILQYRTEHGKFEHAEDLTQVRGIGPAKFEKMKAQVTI